MNDECMDIILSMSCTDAQEIIDYGKERHGADTLREECDHFDIWFTSPSTTTTMMVYIGMVAKGIDIMNCPALADLCEGAKIPEVRAQLIKLRDAIVEELEIDRSCPTCETCTLKGSSSFDWESAPAAIRDLKYCTNEGYAGGIDGTWKERGHFLACAKAIDNLSCGDIDAAVPMLSEVDKAALCSFTKLVYESLTETGDDGESMEEYIRKLCRLGRKSLSLTQCEAITNLCPRAKMWLDHWKSLHPLLSEKLKLRAACEECTDCSKCAKMPMWPAITAGVLGGLLAIAIILIVLLKLKKI